MQRRETRRLPNEDAAGWPVDGFSEDLGHGVPGVDGGDATEETRPLGNHERLPSRLADAGVGPDGLVILRKGMRLRAGSTYVDLDRLDDGEVRAGSRRVVGPGERLVPKHRVDHELWNRLLGRERPGA